MAGITDVVSTLKAAVSTLGQVVSAIKSVTVVSSPPVTTVGALPAAASNVGKLYVVTDATAPTYGATLVGGGAVYALALSDGTAWKAH